jgi:two-component system response regulator YesN
LYNVLIVDDDPFILEGLRCIVDWASLGLEIAGEAENGRAAKAFIEKTPVDVLLTDIRMPEMDGLELIEWIRCEGRDVRCIVLSGYDDYPYLHRALKLGIENYLIKSINEDELLETLRAVVDQLDHARSRREDAPEAVLRDNILLRWMLGRIGRSEFLDRTGLLGMNDRLRAFQVSALRPLPGPDGRAIGREQACQAARRALKEAQRPHVQVFCDLDDDVILIDSGREAPEGVDLSHLKDALEREASGRWFLTRGTVARDFERAAESYRQAKRLMGYALMCPEAGCVAWEDAPGVRQPPPSGDPSDMRSRLLSGDRAWVSSAIDVTFSQAYSPHLDSPDALFTFALRTSIAIMDAALERGIGLPEPFKTIDMLQEAVRGIPTGGALGAWLREAADAYFARHESGRRNFSPLVNRALDHIARHYAEGLSLKLLANRFGANAAYLGRVFAEETGESFSNCLNRVRIEQACKLLTETAEPVSRIAALTGYTSTNYFVNVFKKYVCAYPSRYRLEHKGGV